jgi:crossover junction endodeoxyribonuclease RuvC
MRTLGIDPGSLATGWGIVSGSPTQPTLLACGVIRMPPHAALGVRLARLHASLVEVLARHEPDTAAVEAPFHGVNARASLQLAHARGVVLAVVSLAGLAVTEYAPATVKKTVAGNGRAPKEQIGVLMERLFGRASTEHGHDVSDALSVALCHMANEFQRQRIRSVSG